MSSAVETMHKLGNVAEKRKGTGTLYWCTADVKSCGLLHIIGYPSQFRVPLLALHYSSALIKVVLGVP